MPPTPCINMGWGTCNLYLVCAHGSQTHAATAVAPPAIVMGTRERSGMLCNGSNEPIGRRPWRGRGAAAVPAAVCASIIRRWCVCVMGCIGWRVGLRRWSKVPVRSRSVQKPPFDQPVFGTVLLMRGRAGVGIDKTIKRLKKN